MKDVDEGFYKRADAHIHLSNDQVTPEVEPGMVSASFMYSLARFNAWLAARGFNSADDMRANKEQMIEYFLNHYRMMLEENMDEYIANFKSHLGRSDDDEQT